MVPANAFLARLTLEQSPHSTLLLKHCPDPPVGLCERQPLRGLLAGAASLLLAAFSAGLAAMQPAAGDPALAAQLARGEDVYFADCVSCHNDDLSGGAMHSAPALAGDAFLARWSERNAHDLLELVRTTMPEGQPRSLDEQAYLDVIAFVLVRNKIALGAGALTEQAASQIALRP
jgi:mono/diheme cytochrome c family protein